MQYLSKCMILSLDKYSKTFLYFWLSLKVTVLTLTITILILYGSVNFGIERKYAVVHNK